MAVYVLDIDTNIKGDFGAAAPALTLALEVAFLKKPSAFQILDRRHLDQIVKANQLEKDLQAVTHGKPVSTPFAQQVRADGFIRGELMEGPDGVVLSVALTGLNSEVLWQGRAKHTKAEWQLQQVQEEEAEKLAAEAEMRLRPPSSPGEGPQPVDQKKQTSLAPPSPFPEGELVSYKEYEALNLNVPVQVLTFSGDGRMAAFGTANGSVGLISMTAPSTVHWLAPHKGKVSAIALSRDGSLIASAGDDGLVRVTATSSGRVDTLGQHRGHKGKVLSVAFAPEGEFLASSRDDGSVTIWSTTTRHELYEMLQRGSAAFLLVAFADRGSKVIGVRKDGSIFEWDVKNRAMFRPPTSALDLTVGSVSASASGALLSIGTVSIRRQKGSLDFWESSSPSQVYYEDRIFVYDVERSVFLKTIENMNGQAVSLSVSPDNHYLAVARRPLKGSILLVVIDINHGREIISFPAQGGLRAVAFSPDGQWLGLAADSGNLSFLQMKGIQSTGEVGDLAGGKFILTSSRTPLIGLDPPTVVAIMDLDAHEIDVGTAAAVSDMLRNRIVATGGVILVERGRVDRILKEQDFQHSPRADPALAARIGRIVNAQKIILGSLSKLGSSITISAQVVDVETARIDGIREILCRRCSPEDLPDAVAILKRSLVSDYRPFP